MSEEKTEPYNLGMRSVVEGINTPFGEVLGNYFHNFKKDWIFDKWYEKLIVIGSFILSVAIIVLLIFGIITFK